MDFSDKGVVLLSKLLDLTTTKNKVIANNIANANTPGFRKYDVSFQDELIKAVESKNINKIKDTQEKITTTWIWIRSWYLFIKCLTGIIYIWKSYRRNLKV